MVYQLIIDEFIGYWGCSKETVRRALSGHTGKHVDVLISSLGGDLAHAFDIRQQFLDHGDVTVYLSGGVASAATVIAMGAKRIVMSKYAMFLVHKCSNFIDAWGSYNADQMNVLIEQLTANKEENDKIDLLLAKLYADKCKKSPEDILPVLTKGGWITPQEALEFGFVDELSDKFGKDRKLNSVPNFEAKLNTLGLPPLATPGSGQPEGEQQISDSLLNRIVSATARVFTKHSSAPLSKNDNQSTPIHEMKKYNFSKVTSAMKVDSLTPGDDGKVTVSAEQLEAVNDHIESLENAAADKDASIAAKDDEIKRLKDQVENLQKNPGDDTTEIEDDVKEDSISGRELFNSIKSVI